VTADSTLVAADAPEEIEVEEEPESEEKREGDRRKFEFGDEAEREAEMSDPADASEDDGNEGDRGEDVLDGEVPIEVADLIEVRDFGCVLEQDAHIGNDCDAGK
jgi:hypothetical protein